MPARCCRCCSPAAPSPSTRRGCCIRRRAAALPAEALARAAPALCDDRARASPRPTARASARCCCASPARAATILYFGGNGFTIERYRRLGRRECSRRLGVDLMIVDHRGYGRSEGTPTQANLEADGVAAFDHLAASPASIRRGSSSTASRSAASSPAVSPPSGPTGGVVLESSATTTEDWVAANLRGARRACSSAPRSIRRCSGRGNLANMARIEEPLLILVGARRPDHAAQPVASALYAASPLPAGAQDARGDRWREP